MPLYKGKVWPKILNRRNANQLLAALRKEDLTMGRLWASVEGTADLIAWVSGDCKDKATGEWFDFEATWSFDMRRISEPLDRYKFDGLEVYDYDD